MYNAEQITSDMKLIEKYTYEYVCKLSRKELEPREFIKLIYLLSSLDSRLIEKFCMSKEKGYIEKSVRQYIEKKFYSIGLFTGLPAMYIAIDSLGNSKSSSALQILEKKIKFMTYKLISFIEEHNFKIEYIDYATGLSGVLYFYLQNNLDDSEIIYACLNTIIEKVYDNENLIMKYRGFAHGCEGVFSIIAYAFLKGYKLNNDRYEYVLGIMRDHVVEVSCSYNKCDKSTYPFKLHKDEDIGWCKGYIGDILFINISNKMMNMNINITEVEIINQWKSMWSIVDKKSNYFLCHGKTGILLFVRYAQNRLYNDENLVLLKKVVDFLKETSLETILKYEHLLNSIWGVHIAVLNILNNKNILFKHMFFE